MRRNRTLTLYALLMLLLMIAAMIAALVDPRTLREVNVWVKPIKFMASTALLALTIAWFIGLLASAPLRKSTAIRVLVATLVSTSLFEVLYTSIQAGLGQASHYNAGDPFHARMFGLMAIAALLLATTPAALAWRILRVPGPPESALFRHAVIVGLITSTVLSILSGILLGAHQPPPGAGLPMLGWQLSAGDLRPAHFVGLHAMQLIPLAGFLLQQGIARRGASIAIPFAALYLFLLLYLGLWWHLVDRALAAIAA